jgi:hypothetical protein
MLSLPFLICLTYICEWCMITKVWGLCNNFEKLSVQYNKNKNWKWNQVCHSSYLIIWQNLLCRRLFSWAVSGTCLCLYLVVDVLLYLCWNDYWISIQPLSNLNTRRSHILLLSTITFCVRRHGDLKSLSFIVWPLVAHMPYFLCCSIITTQLYFTYCNLLFWIKCTSIK